MKHEELHALIHADLDGDAQAATVLAEQPANWAEALGQMMHFAEEEVIARRAEVNAQTFPSGRTFHEAHRQFSIWRDNQMRYIKRLEQRIQHAKALASRERQAQQRERAACRIEQRLWRVEKILGITEHQEWWTYHERLLRVEHLVNATPTARSSAEGRGGA